jgi:Tfp pilus assembly protein PilF/CBS domain-containing protein
LRASAVTVDQAMQPPVLVLDARKTAADCLAAIQEGAEASRAAWPVLDEGRLIGMATRGELREVEQEGPAERTVGEWMRRRPLRAAEKNHVHPDEPVYVALRRMGRAGFNVLPVVDRKDPRHLVGVLSLTDLPAAYDRAGEEAAGEMRRVEGTSARTLLAAVLAALFGLFLLGGVLAHHYYSARVETARRAYDNGTQLVREHRDAEAVESFRKALSLVHTTDYRLALGLALEGSGRDAEARVYLGEVLRQRPGDGPANRALAQIEIRGGDLTGARESYRRAVEGAWSAGAQRDRVGAVFEFVNLLAKAGKTREAVGRLLLESGRESGPASLVRVGYALLGLGAAREAAQVFEDAITHAPAAPDAYLGLGDARMARQDYRAALDAYRRALKLAPQSEPARQRIEACEQQLTPRDRARR